MSTRTAVEYPEGVSPTLLRRTAVVSFIGASIDSYDFFIYGTAAALVFPHVFFPEVSPFMGVLLSFASFGVGFVARPVGGIIFGHIGDVHGRKFALVACLLGMAACTTVMGLLPSYATIGAASGVLLIVLRLIQGVFFGGEAGGALMLLGEVAPKERRGYYGAIAIAGAPGGIIIANAVFYVVTAATSDETLYAWAWRIPFLSSVILIALSYYANLKLKESPLFLKRRLDADADRAGAVKADVAAAHERGSSIARGSSPRSGSSQQPGQAPRSPVVIAVRRHWREILLGAGTYAALNVTFYVIATFAVHHAASPEVGMEKDAVLGALLIASFVMLVWSIISGRLSDTYGRHVILLGGAGGFAVWSFLMWPLTNSGRFWLLLVAFVVGLGIFAGMLAGAVGAFLMELFPTETRFSGVSLSVQLASVFAGAFAPLIAAALYSAYDSTVPIAMFVTAWCLVTVGCVGYLLVSRRAPYDV